jgi:AAA domain/Primase C terminal 2 (PriCT-2)/Bifunctional DNA primase/polymerase, N-terminal
MALRNDDPFAASPPLPHEQLRAAVTARRIAYVKLGYQPIPIKSGDKKPVLDGWQNMTIDLDTVGSWAEARRDALSTGIRTKHTPAVDIDVHDNAAVADQIQQALLDMLPPGGTFLKRVGKPPKRLIPFRTTAPFKKIRAAFRLPGEDKKTIPERGIEVLGDGQQFVAEGIHPDTHMPYRWDDNVGLLNVAHEHLPLLDEATARRFVDEATRVMLAPGYEQTSSSNGKAKTSNKPKPNGKTNGHEDISRIKNALSFASAADRDTWIEIGQALHAHLGDSGRAIWDQWSATCPEKYDPDDADRVWCSFGKRDGRTIASLFFRAIKGGWRDDGRCSPNDTESAADELKIIWASDLEMCGVDWLWPGRFALGKIGLVAGLPDYGKGQIAAFLAAAITAAIELPCEEGGAPQGNVIWFNAEDDNRDTIIPRLTAAGANLKRVAFVNGARVDGEDKSFSLVTDLALLHKAIKKIGNVVLVIIDPMSAYLGVGKVDSRSATDVRGLLAPLKQLTEELHIAVIGIAHFNKKDDIKSALLRVSDSIAYVAAARHVYAVLDDPEDKNSKLFVKAKNNLARDTKALRYGMGVRKVGHDAKLGVDIEAPFIVWHPQHVDISANEAMAAAGGHTAKREAREFLLERLEAGPVKFDDIVDAAKQEGIAEKTLRRAKKDLGIKSCKEHGRTDGPWFWQLPPKRESWPSS